MTDYLALADTLAGYAAGDEFQRPVEEAERVIRSLAAPAPVAQPLTLNLIQANGEFCVSLNDYRIAGPKPWGGGTVIKRWTVSMSDIESALGIAPPAHASRAGQPTDEALEHAIREIDALAMDHGLPDSVMPRAVAILRTSIAGIAPSAQGEKP